MSTQNPEPGDVVTKVLNASLPDWWRGARVEKVSNRGNLMLVRTTSAGKESRRRVYPRDVMVRSEDQFDTEMPGVRPKKTEGVNALRELAIELMRMSLDTPDAVVLIRDPQDHRMHTALVAYDVARIDNRAVQVFVRRVRTR